jgi:hypothetical protein
MLKKLFTVSLLVLALAVSLYAGESQRVLLHISRNGDQEAMVIRKGESASNAIARAEKGVSMAKVNGLVDTLFTWDKTATQYSAFSFNAHDVGFQWYMPAAGGLVRELWFRTAGAPYATVGLAHKAQVRAWYPDSRVASLPTTEWSSGGTAPAGALGYYKAVNNGEGLRTPFRDEATDTAFVKGAAQVAFDPLGKEVQTWLPGGAPINLIPDSWHKLVVADWGDSIPFQLGVPFGFTIQNLTSYAMVGTGFDTTMTIAATASLAYPYHSYKFYQNPASGLGWAIRQYEWEYYVVVEYTTDRAPKATLQQLFTTLKTAARTVTAKVTDDNPGGGPAGVKSVDLYTKINSGAYQKSSMTGNEPNFTGTIPGANPGDTVSYYVVATDVNNNATTTTTWTYTIFNPTQPYLFIWNGRSIPTGQTVKNLARYYMFRDSTSEAVKYDIWDVKTYGKTDIPDLLPRYNVVMEATGDGGQADLTGYAGAWLPTGSASAPHVYLWSDQDHGFISNFADTTFLDTDPHAKYFGVKTLGPQDYPYTGTNVTWPWRLTPQDSTDNLVGFIQKYANKTGIGYWYNPNFELPGILNWMDQMIPTTSAKALFKDLTGGQNRVVGVRNDAADNSWHAMWLAFDWLSTDFLSDTTKHPTSAGVPTDPKYAWILDAGSILKNALKAYTAVRPTDEVVPGVFSLSQNYPNPFNPNTEIEYNLPKNSFVTLKVYNSIGQVVATLVNTEMPAGKYTSTFDGARVASGVYFYTMTAGNFTQTNKMILMK